MNYKNSTYNLKELGSFMNHIALIYKDRNKPCSVGDCLSQSVHSHWGIMWKLGANVLASVSFPNTGRVLTVTVGAAQTAGPKNGKMISLPLWLHKLYRVPVIRKHKNDTIKQALFLFIFLNSFNSLLNFVPQGHVTAQRDPEMTEKHWG